MTPVPSGVCSKKSKGRASWDECEHIHIFSCLISILLNKLSLFPRQGSCDFQKKKTDFPKNLTTPVLFPPPGYPGVSGRADGGTMSDPVRVPPSGGPGHWRRWLLPVLASAAWLLLTFFLKR